MRLEPLMREPLVSKREGSVCGQHTADEQRSVVRRAQPFHPRMLCSYAMEAAQPDLDFFAEQKIGQVGLG